jgi:uncharacterized membrane protein YkvA (DUF1232 family)
LAHDPITIDLNPREQRLYDRFRTRVASLELGPISGLRDLLLLLPDLAVLLLRLLRDPRVSYGDKGIALLGLGYVLSPIDLLPEILLGPIGLLDDLFVVAATLSRLLNHVHPDVVRSHWPGRGDALDAIQRVTHWAETFVRSRLPGFVRGLIGTGSPN